jgi:hypothetical protein
MYTQVFWAYLKHSVMCLGVSPGPKLGRYRLVVKSPDCGSGALCSTHSTDICAFTFNLNINLNY